MSIGPNKFQRAIIRGIGIEKFLKEKDRYDDVPMATIEGIEDFKEKENKIWYSGDPSLLEWFYKTNHPHRIYHGHQFWRVVNTNVPRVHYPLASTISNAFGRLLFANTPEMKVESNLKTVAKSYQRRLDEINEINDMLSLLQESAQLQSYSGGVALKINFDPTISDVPLITSYAAGQYKEYKRYRQTVYIDFFDYYGDDFKLVSRYGKGYISYKLYKNDRVVPLTSIPETADLEDVAFAINETDLVNIMFAAVIPNKAGSLSDYDGLYSSFSALDEVYSTLVNYIRKAKPNTFISEDIAKKDKSGKPLPLNEFDNIITILDGTPEGAATNITRDIPKIEVEGYLSTFRELRQTILAKVGVSPASIGIDAAGANASGDALNIRERVSSSTRSEKLAIWREKLDMFLYSVLIFDDFINKGEQSNGFYKLEEIVDFGVLVDFGPYHEKSVKEKIEIFGKAIENKTASISFAVEQIYGKTLTPQEKEQLVKEIKEENGIVITIEEIE